MRLLDENRLRRRAGIPRSLDCGRRRRVEPRLVRPDRQRDAREQQRGAGERAQPEAWLPRHQRGRHCTPVDKGDPRHKEPETHPLQRVAENTALVSRKSEDEIQHAQRGIACEHDDGQREPQVRLPHRSRKYRPRQE